MKKTKFRLVVTADNIVVIAEDGGVAEIRYTEPDGTLRKSTTDYYKRRLTEKALNSKKDIWDFLAEGDMFYNDWTTDFDIKSKDIIDNDENKDLTYCQGYVHVDNALDWLVPGVEFELDETIWPDFKA